MNISQISFPNSSLVRVLGYSVAFVATGFILYKLVVFARFYFRQPPPEHSSSRAGRALKPLTTIEPSTSEDLPAKMIVDAKKAEELLRAPREMCASLKEPEAQSTPPAARPTLTAIYQDPAPPSERAIGLLAFVESLPPSSTIDNPSEYPSIKADFLRTLEDFERHLQLRPDEQKAILEAFKELLRFRYILTAKLHNQEVKGSVSALFFAAYYEAWTTEKELETLVTIIHQFSDYFVSTYSGPPHATAPQRYTPLAFVENILRTKDADHPFSEIHSFSKAMRTKCSDIYDPKTDLGKMFWAWKDLRPGYAGTLIKKVEEAYGELTSVPEDVLHFWGVILSDGLQVYDCLKRELIDLSQEEKKTLLIDYQHPRTLFSNIVAQKRDNKVCVAFVAIGEYDSLQILIDKGVYILLGQGKDISGKVHKQSAFLAPCVMRQNESFDASTVQFKMQAGIASFTFDIKTTL
jgi:hypothetical protein